VAGDEIIVFFTVPPSKLQLLWVIGYLPTARTRGLLYQDTGILPPKIAAEAGRACRASPRTSGNSILEFFAE
jgi:hypothetical protein